METSKDKRRNFWQRKNDGPFYIDSPSLTELRDIASSPLKLSLASYTAQEMAEQARSEIPALIQTISSELSRTDPLAIWGSLHILDAIRRARLPGPNNFGSEAMLEILASLVCSSDAQDLRRRVNQPFDLKLLWSIENHLRTLAGLKEAQLMGASFARSGENVMDGVRALLEFEYDFDRMAGFDPQLQVVARAIFSKIDATAQEKLGFKFSHALDLARAYSQHRQSEVDALMTTPPPPLERGMQDGDSPLLAQVAQITAFALAARAPLEQFHRNTELAKQADIPLACMSPLVRSLSVKVGSVPPGEALTNTRTRHLPIIELDEGAWMWPRPVDFPHSALTWAYLCCQGNDRLLQQFDKARQATAEELAATTLARVFDTSSVFTNVTYPDTESQAEADIIIPLPGLNILVEVKGGRMSEPGRRGAPDRTRRHVQELVQKAAAQNLRTRDAINSGKTLSTKSGVVPVDPMGEYLNLIVMLDRVDPFSTRLAGSKEHAQGHTNWILALPDLIMLCDILDSPEEFVTYARARVRKIESGSQIFVEADSLGSWCDNRFSDFDVVERADGRVLETLSTVSATINDYYTQVAMLEQDECLIPIRDRLSKPNTGIPAAVVEALAAMRARKDRKWLHLVDEAGQIPRNDWNRLRPLLRVLDRPVSERSRRGARATLRKASSGLVVGGRVSVRYEESQEPPLSLTCLSEGCRLGCERPSAERDRTCADSGR